PKIQNEPGISNKRATIAMAKLANDPNSATSQWFINLRDNGGGTGGLDTTNDGFTVFGRVIGDGMEVADTIGSLPVFDRGSPFNEIPLRDYVSPNPVTVPNLVSLPSIAKIASVPSPLSFSATSSDAAIAEASVSDTRLLVTGKAPGNAQIEASGVAPGNARESAILQTLSPAAYTAIVRSNTSSAGVGSVEVYQLP
nr:peptidylprolyl isomerase [Chthoniobacterales bacterium]